MKDNNFGLLRLVGAYFVFAGHMYVLLGFGTPTLMGQPVQRLGIIMFFLAGGYVITLSWERDPHFIRYLIKRIMRIVPPLAVYAVIAALFIGPLTTELDLKTYFTHAQFRDYFRNILLEVRFFLPGCFTTNPYPHVVNGSLWSLPAEFIMYLIIPVLYTIGDKLRCKKPLFVTMAVLTTIGAAVHMAFFPQWIHVVYSTDIGQVIDIVPFYFIGMAVAAVGPSKKIFNVRNGLVTLAVVHCFAIQNVFISLLVSMVAVSYIMYCFAFTPNVAKLKNMEISYGVYLYGFAFQQLTIYLLYGHGIRPSLMVIMIISLIPTVLIAMLSERLVEQPVGRLTKKICACIGRKDATA